MEHNIWLTHLINYANDRPLVAHDGDALVGRGFAASHDRRPLVLGLGLRWIAFLAARFRGRRSIRWRNQFQGNQRPPAPQQRWRRIQSIFWNFFCFRAARKRKSSNRWSFSRHLTDDCGRPTEFERKQQNSSIVHLNDTTLKSSTLIQLNYLCTQTRCQIFTFTVDLFKTFKKTLDRTNNLNIWRCVFKTKASNIFEAKKHLHCDTDVKRCDTWSTIWRLDSTYIRWGKQRKWKGPTFYFL